MKKRILLSILVVVILVAGIVVYLQTRTNHDVPKGDVQTGSQATKGEPEAASDKDSSGSPSAKPDGKNGTEQTDNNSATLLAPSGTFIGNHKPNLSGNPAPNTIESVCSTTSGATCTITFTKDGVTKALEPRLTDRGGSAYWTWKLQDIGLSEGEWNVQAKATLGSQTKTTDDAMTLEVRQ